MSDFVVSARKYRPATFDTVVGQQGITTTLKNAIKNKHLSQAYLFCGPRGVGKTTCARILAKTINCFNITDNIEACDKCESCTSFNEGSSLNFFELDAASNNSVDDIRNLISQVNFAPQLGNYKVYIIDEVHMLSTAAFNAFLKTLEEPPKHAIFILATTEKHKIIPTILSRCQIFDFGRIKPDDIVKQLQFIAKNEGVVADAEALHIIAQKADGGMRDACSVFDQLVTFSGNNLTYTAVIENLNVLDYEYYFKIVDAVLQSDIPATLLIFNEILTKGFDGHIFISGLAEHLRDIMISKDSQTLQLMEKSDAVKTKYKNQSDKCDTGFILKAISICSKTDMNYKASKNPRLLVEIALMQMASLKLLPVEEEKKNFIINASSFNSASIAPKEKKQYLKQEHPKEENAVKSPSHSSSTVSKVKTGLSINAIVNKKNTAITSNKIEDASNTSNNETIEKLQTNKNLETAWKEFTESIKQKKKVNLYTMLTNFSPLLNDNNCIELEIPNKVLEEQLNEEKTEMMRFLRFALNNNAIQLKVTISESNQGKRIYTSSDKYNHMAAKNSSIKLLRQKFDLDIDF